MVFAAVRNAASTSPITALGGPPGPPRPPPGAGAGGGAGVGAGAVAARAARSRACARYVALLCVATAPSSQTTFSELRASLATHQLSATIATPEARELLPCPAGSMMNACLMPGSFLISSRLALTTFPPKTSHFTSTAWSMLGNETSMLNAGRPVTMSRLSTPRIRLPMILKSRGFLSAAVDGGGFRHGQARRRSTTARRRSRCAWSRRASRHRPPCSARSAGRSTAAPPPPA